MTHTLTDRYVHVAVAHIPRQRRRDTERELRSAIADDIDARLAGGESAARAEYAALRELGDPIRMAARYTYAARALIGPDSYPSYVQATRGTCATVLPILYVTLVLVQHARNHDLWMTFLRPLGITVTVAMYLLVILTALFVLGEHTRAAAGGAEDDAPWTPDRLADTEIPRWNSRAELIGRVAQAALLVLALFAQRLFPVHTPGGGTAPILNPQLWHGWIPYFLCLLVAAVLLETANLFQPKRTRLAAVLGSAFALAAAIPLGRLCWQARVIDPAVAHEPSVLTAQGSWIAWLAILMLALLTARYLIGVWRPED
ncbi:permease prefix domain 1-containing protein [Nocardia sp. alder85J]|uniref:permease prefix domain 1-containing protein n=1 Tax=Nocardia sp. alder85J TaxID=2862949 RepID=UPI001CD5AF15|nr:permease prefix domain 1-containing protein [Nocardia sp. alder85J]MCX4098627.1 permease prefix domain 1-containing protein [Nocardia sp. alder85J]